MKSATLNHVSVKQRIGNICLKVSAAMAAAFALGLMYTQEVFADGITDAAKKADAGIWGTAKGVVPSILGIVIVIGGMLLIAGGEKGKEGVKSKVAVVLIGVGLVVFAPSIVTVINGWVK
jgi:type IV secretory pathway VirB2 component (pilin)